MLAPRDPLPGTTASILQVPVVCIRRLSAIHRCAITPQGMDALRNRPHRRRRRRPITHPYVALDVVVTIWPVLSTKGADGAARLGGG